MDLINPEAQDNFTVCPTECNVNLPVQLLIFRLIWVKVLASRLAILRCCIIQLCSFRQLLV